MGRPAPTRNGYDFFVVASLLQKSLRRGDIVLASRACNELLPRYGNYCWNRMLTVSAEDCAEMVTQEIIALHQAWVKVRPKQDQTTKGRIFFAKAIVLLAKAKHSRDADELNILVSDRIPDEVFEAAMRQVGEVMKADESHFDIPDWVYDVHTQKGRRMGRSKDEFLREEHDALDNPTPSLFGNFDEMLETWGYVEPTVEFGGGDDGGA